MADIINHLGTVAAVIIGGFVTIYVAHLRHRSEREAAKEDRVHEREITASANALEAISKLLLLEQRPDQDFELSYERRFRRGEGIESVQADQPSENVLQEWDRRRDGLLLALDIASLDLSDQRLQERLGKARDIIRYASGLWDLYRWPESKCRRIACEHAKECLGRFRRGDRMSAIPKPFIEALEGIDLYIEMMEENERARKEYYREQRKREREEKDSEADRSGGTETGE